MYSKNVILGTSCFVSIKSPIKILDLFLLHLDWLKPLGVL